MENIYKNPPHNQWKSLVISSNLPSIEPENILSLKSRALSLCMLSNPATMTGNKKEDDDHILPYKSSRVKVLRREFWMDDYKISTTLYWYSVVKPVITKIQYFQVCQILEICFKVKNYIMSMISTGIFHQQQIFNASWIKKTYLSSGSHLPSRCRQELKS